MVLASAFAVCAQNHQPIGYEHTISFGVGYGYGSAPLANYAGGFIDINIPAAALSDGAYFRTRLGLDIDQITKDFAASASAGFQYMQPIVSTLYVYPFLRVKAEYHNTPGWNTKADFTPGGGAGIEYQFTKNLGLFAEGVYECCILGSAGRASAMAGIVFAFGQGKHSATRAARANTAKLAKAAKADAQRAKAEQNAANQMRKEAAAVAAKAAKPTPADEPITAAPSATFDGGSAPVTAAPSATFDGGSAPVTTPGGLTAAEPSREPSTVAEPVEAPASTPVIEALPVNGIRINKGTTVSVPFVSGSYTVGNSARTKILTMVPYLMSHPEAVVELAAYGDKHDENADATLAAKRERAVRDILTGAGIDSDRIVAPQKTAVQAVTTQPGSVAIVTIK